MCSLLIAHYSLLIAHYSLLIAHCSLLITHYSLLTTHCSLLITHCSLLITHCSLLTAHCFIKKVRSIKDGAIHVITLLRNKTTGFTVDGKCISAKVLIQRQERKGFKICRQNKSLYARVKAEYNVIPVQLFIIRYGRSSK